MEYSNYNKPKRPKKPMTEQQALLKLTTLCTQAEHCSQEMLDKMKKWELSEEAIARNMEFLTQKKFVDDERFARFFINDKIKYNKWGRRKVEQALWMKHPKCKIVPLDMVGRTENGTVYFSADEITVFFQRPIGPKRNWRRWVTDMMYLPP